MKRRNFLKSIGIASVLSLLSCKPEKIEKPEDFRLSKKDIKKIIDNRSSEGFPNLTFRKRHLKFFKNMGKKIN